MNASDLREEIAIEIDSIERTLVEIAGLVRDVGEREPTAREVAAAGLFLASFYNGIENVLKRIWAFHGLPLPHGDTWHIELLKGFCDPPREGLPRLLDAPLEADLAPYRRLRHVVRHAYGFQLRWDQLRPGLAGAQAIFTQFRSRVEAHLRSLGA